MKHIFLAFAACLMALSIHAAELNIYASGLKAGALSADKKLTIEYVLNAPATSLEFQVLNTSGMAIRRIPITDATLLTKGTHTGVEIDLSDCPAGEFTWALKASADARTKAEQVTNGSDLFHMFFHPRGIAVDNNPKNDYFGRIYVTNAAAGIPCKKSNAASTNQSLGIFIMDPLLQDVTNQGRNGYAGGVTWSGSYNGPRRIQVAENGEVFACDMGDNSGIWMMDPANPSAAFKEVLAVSGRGTTYTKVHAFDIVGDGADRTIYTLENIAITGHCGRIHKVGTCETPTTTSKKAAYSTTGIVNGDVSIAADGRGGVWIIQYRGSAASEYVIQHANAEGTRDFWIGKGNNNNLLSSSTSNATRRGSLVLNKDKNLIAYSTNSQIFVCSITYDTKGVPTLTKLYSTPAWTSNIDGLAFDYANNLYVASATPEIMISYATPSDNEQTTPAQAKYGFTIEPKPGEVIATSISIEEGTSIDLIKGNTLQLHANVRPIGYTSTVSWSSDAESIATVSADGLVTGVAAGTATITAMIDAQVATLTVTVKKPNMAGGTYTVGGAGADFASLYAACQKVNESNITGDITLAICADLTETKNSGIVNTSEHTISIRPDGKELRTITFAYTKTYKVTGSIIIGAQDPVNTAATVATKNVIIDGCAEGSDVPALAIVHDNLGGSLRIAAGSSNNAIKNLHISYGKNASGNLYPLWMSGTAAAKVTNNTISSCTLIANKARRAVLMENTVDALIENNTFEFADLVPAALSYGIHGYTVSGTVTIRGNKFTKVTTNTNAAEIGTDGKVTNYGIAAISCQGGTWIIENNYFAGMDFLNTTASATARMSYIRTIVSGVTVRHNTFHIPSLSNKPANVEDGGEIQVAAITTTEKDIVVANNLFVSEEETALHKFINNTHSDGISVSNNVFQVVAANENAYVYNTTLLTDYLAANATAKSATVTFINAATGDLSLAAPSERDVRLAVPAIAAVTTDINGTARHTGSVYAGAWEGPGFKLIVNSDASLSDLISDGTNTCEVVVTDGATLTCDADKTVASLRIEDGATLVVDDATLAITNTLTAHSQDDVQPQILTTGAGKITYGTFQFLKRIPADRYYFFSLPFACETSSVTVDDGVAAKYNVDWNIRYYDGAGFAANPSNKSFWKVDNTGMIEPNQGYTIGVATAVAGQYRELAFTASGAVDFSKETAKTIAVAANGATGTKESYKGWSFIMNPYTSNFDGATDGLKISSNALAYVTIPDPGQNKTYTTKLINDAGDLPPFFGFFVQVAEAGDVVFTPGTPNAKAAPARRANGAEVIAEPLLVGIRLSNGVKEDETTLVIGEQFTEAYEIGSDLMKMIGYADKPQLYTFDAETKYAFHSLNETAATQVHPLGVYLPAESEYTFSLKPIRGEREVEAVYLYDYETNACVDLMQEDYTFTSGTLNSEKRFALSPQLAPQATTAIDSNTATDLAVWQSGALEVCVEGVAAGDRVRIFDIQGRKVSEWTATETVSVGNVPASGMYVVECTGATGVQVVKLMINH